MNIGGAVIIMLGVCAIGLFMFAATSMSTHRFQADPNRPTECRICGRRKDKHPS